MDELDYIGHILLAFAWLWGALVLFANRRKR
jgi:hypothetical protein